MTQIERITHMEHLLDAGTEAAQALLDALERYEAVQAGIAELEACYTSPLWMQDFEDDSAGKLPKHLKRGVLSEDAVYDLLRMQQEICGRLHAEQNAEQS